MFVAPTINSIHFFGISVKFYGLIISFAILVSILVFYCLSKIGEKELNFDIFCDILPIVTIFGIIGARIYYVLLTFSYYKNHILESLMIWQGGISIHGAIIAGLFALYIFCKNKKISFLKYSDAICTILPLSQAIGRWGNFFNQEAFGKPCEYFWCMYISPTNRPLEYVNSNYFHPTFLYESILDFIIFLILLTIFLKCKNLKSGIILCLYLILYSLARIAVESLRIDATVYYFNIPFPIISSLLILFIAIIFLFKIYKNN